MTGVAKRLHFDVRMNDGVCAMVDTTVAQGQGPSASEANLAPEITLFPLRAS